MDAVEVAGLRIACQRADRGPALVPLHGAYEDSRIWRPQFEALSDEFTAVAWDAPGCGNSSDRTFRAKTLAAPLPDSFRRLFRESPCPRLVVGVRRGLGALSRASGSTDFAGAGLGLRRLGSVQC
jgi:pimeloyl-ACP methyl ester carboxylesterase